MEKAASPTVSTGLTTVTTTVVTSAASESAGTGASTPSDSAGPVVVQDSTVRSAYHYPPVSSSRRNSFALSLFLYSGPFFLVVSYGKVLWPTAWNTLPSDLHDITDTGTFRKRLKSVLYDRAYH